MPSENYFHTANLRTMKIDSQLCKKALHEYIGVSIISLHDDDTWSRRLSYKLKRMVDKHCCSYILMIN